MRANAERDLLDVARRIASLVAAIEAGGDATSLVARLAELEARRRNLEASIPGGASASVVALHSHAADRYRKRSSMCTRR